MAASTVVGALSFEKVAAKFKYSTVYRVAILGVATSNVLMSFLPPYWLMIVFGFFLGILWGPITPLLNTVIQRKIPPSKRGRVFSLEMVIWSGGPMISMLFTGMAVDGFGVQPVYWFLSFFMLASGMLLTFSKYMREINTADFS